MIPREVIEEIKKRLDIVEIISEYVSLERVGSNYRALCPFHSETRPSFYVNPKLQLYHCFGCGAKGDVIKFVQDIENISFYEALEKLAVRAGVDLSPYTEKKSEYAIYTAFHEELKREYQKALGNSKEAMEYIEKRGLSVEDLEKYELGYSPPNSRLPIKVARRMNLSLDKVLQYGLAFRTGEGLRDAFENRIIFPIKNESGSTIAFGGRLLGEGEPKYVNSRDTKYFSKSRVLFMMDRAKKAIKANDLVIVTEGYMDALAFHRAGFENTVAVLGTALTRYNAMKISSMTHNVVLAFDSDDSGRKAALKSLELLISMDFEVLVVDYHPYKDGDEVFSNEGRSGLERVLENAMRSEEFIVKTVSSRFDLSVPAGVEKCARTLGMWIDKFRKMGKSTRAREILKIGAKEVGLDVLDFERMTGSATSETVEKRFEGFGPEEEIAYLYVNYEDMREDILEAVSEVEDILSERLREFLSLVSQGDLNHSFERMSKETGDWIFHVLRDVPPPSDPKKAFEDALGRLKILKLKKRLKEIDERIYGDIDQEEKSILLNARMEIVRRMKSLQGR